MIYVMSDLHGRYDLYIKMLEKINLGKEDTLYILGDVVDRGADGVKILLDMMKRDNIVPLIGNHEHMAFSVLKKFCVEITEDNYDKQIDEKTYDMYGMWIYNGGEDTLKGFMRLDKDNRESVLNYLGEFGLFEEVEAGGNRFVLAHGGFENFSEDRDLDSYSLEETAWARCDYNKRYFKDKYLITGHTPTALIDKKSTGKIYKKNGHIAIDCGAFFLNKLGCIRLDDMEEFYVE
ncbi:MAG: metallophosphoesterase [Clostridia bacterium]|nr:metallophosphoesterase [Clostridia bacterium]